jgi:hypothetical protein
MAEMTPHDVQVHVDLAETIARLHRSDATMRFYADGDGPYVRVACHTDPKVPGAITASVQPVVDGSPRALAQALKDAEADIAAQTQRSTLSIVR